MDFIGSRAVPALSAALLLQAGVAGADCKALDGTYARASLPRADGTTVSLTEFATLADRGKLTRTGRQAGAVQFGAPQVMQRPKVTHLAAKVAVTHAPGNNRMRFLDAEGKVLAESRIDRPHPWRCDGARLVRVTQGMAGIGDDIRTERVEEAFERGARGELVLRTKTTVIEGRGKGSVSEARFPAAR